MSEMLLLLNPHKRGSKAKRVRRSKRRSTSKGVFAMAKRHSRSRRSRRYSRNPISFRGVSGRAQSLLKPAVTGAAGALAVNAIVNYAPLPDTLKQGRMIYLTKAGLAIALAMVGGKILGAARATEMAKGSLIVTATELGRDLALSYGGVNLSGTGYLSPAAIVSPLATRGLPLKTMGQYVQGRVPRPGVQSIATMRGLRGLNGMGQYINLRRR